MQLNWFGTLTHPDNIAANQTNIDSKRQAVYKRRPPNSDHLNMILLDTSASNLNQRAISHALDAIEQLFQQAYLQRQHCTLLSFGNEQVETLITPQKAIKHLSKKLPQVQAGGGTPLNKALKTAQIALKKQQQRYPSQTLYVLTDGKSNTPISEICFACEVVIIDTERAQVALGQAKKLAAQLNARYQPLYPA